MKFQDKHILLPHEQLTLFIKQNKLLGNRINKTRVILILFIVWVFILSYGLCIVFYDTLHCTFNNLRRNNYSENNCGLTHKNISEQIYSNHNLYMYDFDKHYAAIANEISKECYIYNIVNNTIDQPKNRSDLLIKLRNQYYIFRKHFNKTQYKGHIPLSNLTKFGNVIKTHCLTYTNYMIE